MYSIRKANLDDIPALRNLMQRSVNGLAGAFYSPAQTEAAARFLTIPDPVIIEDGTYYIVEHGGEIVGCGGWSTRRKLFTGSDSQESLSADWLNPASDPAKIRAFFVSPDHARQGIGRLIYQACEQGAREAGFRALELMATLPGVPLYESLGFSASEPADILLPDGSYLPCLPMSKTLCS